MNTNSHKKSKALGWGIVLGLVCSGCATPVGSIGFSADGSSSSGTGNSTSQQRQQITWSLPSSDPTDEEKAP